MKRSYKTGLVLSGGGTRGFAHLGVIAALAEKGIRPEVISGTSAGAIAGAFIAAGKSPQETMDIFKKGWFFKYSKLNIPVDGLMKLSGLQEVIEQEIEYNNIEDLHIPFFIAVSNLTRGIVEYRNSGPLCQTVIASSSIPVLFSPVEIEGQLYVDGGLMDNMPVEPIKNDCDQVIVINISPLSLRDSFKNLIQIATRTFYMSVNSNVNEVHKHASLFIEPAGIEKYDILSLGHASDLYDIGYKHVKSMEFPGVPG